MEFAEGIRGKVLWHDEYRTQKMYEANAQGNPKFGTRTFAAAFDPRRRRRHLFTTIPVTGATCVTVAGYRSTPTGTLDAALQAPQEFMTADGVQPLPGQGLYLHRANTAHEAGLF